MCGTNERNNRFPRFSCQWISFIDREAPKWEGFECLRETSTLHREERFRISSFSNSSLCLKNKNHITYYNIQTKDYFLTTNRWWETGPACPSCEPPPYPHPHPLPVTERKNQPSIPLNKWTDWNWDSQEQDSANSLFPHHIAAISIQSLFRNIL